MSDIAARLGPQAQLIWDGLELRTAAMLGAIDRLDEREFQWQPPNGANSIAWLLWHISEVEDNWVRDRLLSQERRYPFGASVKATPQDQFPAKAVLLDYFHDVRALTRTRLAGTSEQSFDAEVLDDHFGRITARQLWAGVVTSGAWHGGQIVIIANRLLPPRGEM